MAEDPRLVVHGQRHDRDDGRSRAGAAGRSRRRAGRPGRAARDLGAPPRAISGELGQLVWRRRPERGLGAAGLRRAGRRPPVGEGLLLHAARRAGPGRRLARAPLAPRGTHDAPQRAWARLAPLSRSRHRSHGGFAAECAVDVGCGRDAYGDPVRRKHADRGDLHLARCEAHRRDDSLHATAPSRRPDHPRAGADLRRGARRPRRGRDRRGPRPQPPGDDRERRPPRRGRATRTPPVTSRMAPACPSSSTASRTEGSTLPTSTWTSWWAVPSSKWTRCSRTERRCR